MKRLKVAAVKGIALSIAMGLTLSAAVAQTTFLARSMSLSLTGTSTLHDWEMKAAGGSSDVACVVDATGKVTDISKLNFSIPTKNLKSEHTLMDDNTYKALNADKAPTITFVLTSGTVTSLGNNNYQFNCLGKLTIAGTTRETDLVATARYNPADQSITVTGVKKMRMTDYNVKPPTVMMGTIKTGNDIAITYNLRFTK